MNTYNRKGQNFEFWTVKQNVQNLPYTEKQSSTGHVLLACEIMTMKGKKSRQESQLYSKTASQFGQCIMNSKDKMFGTFLLNKSLQNISTCLIMCDRPVAWVNRSSFYLTKCNFPLHSDIKQLLQLCLMTDVIGFLPRLQALHKWQN